MRIEAKLAAPEWPAGAGARVLDGEGGQGPSGGAFAALLGGESQTAGLGWGGARPAGPGERRDPSEGTPSRPAGSAWRRESSDGELGAGELRRHRRGNGEEAGEIDERSAAGRSASGEELLGLVGGTRLLSPLVPPADPVAPPPPARALGELVEQVGQWMSRLAYVADGSGRAELRLGLDGGRLGPVDVHLVRSAGGDLEARFRVRHPLACQALDGALPELLRALEARGAGTVTLRAELDGAAGGDPGRQRDARAPESLATSGPRPPSPRRSAQLDGRLRDWIG
jgi:hypothetical protein